MILRFFQRIATDTPLGRQSYAGHARCYIRAEEMQCAAATRRKAGCGAREGQASYPLFHR